MQLYVSRDGQQFGPYTIEDARAHLAAGSLLPTDLAFLDGAPNWAPLVEVLAAAPQPALSANPPASQPVGTATQPAPMGKAQSAKKTKKKSKPKKKDKDIIKEIATKEKIVVKKFVRFKVGEGV